MAVTLNANSSTGFIATSDTSGVLQLQTGGTTAVTVDASQRTAFVAGTAALPAITTTGDTNTGIFFPAADTIAFSEGGVESMRIDASGNVGIGTSSPNSAGVSLACTLNASNASTGGIFELNGAGTRYGYLFANASNTVLSSVQSLPLLFSTNNTERARIDSSGNLLVGTTTAIAKVTVYGATGNCASFQNDSGAGRFPVLFYNGSTNVGNIATSTTATSYNTSSDYRLKNTIAPMTGALEKVALLKPVTYKWNADGSDGQGFIAHELQEVVEGCVTGEKDAVDAEGNPVYQGIDTSFLVATLTAAIQEQQALITKLQADVAALKGASA